MKQETESKIFNLTIEKTLIEALIENASKADINFYKSQLKKINKEIKKIHQ